MRRALLAVIATGCAVHDTRVVNDPARWQGDDGELRLIRKSDGATTSWIPRSELVIAGAAVCKRNHHPWKSVTAVRVAQLTDANIAAILVDLPRSIRVTHKGGGVITLATDGRDLSRWLGSRAHDPADAGVRRYHVEAWGVWRGPLTWLELADAGTPMLGWPVEGTRAERRDLATGKTIAVSLLIIPVFVVAAGIAVAAQTPSPFPSDGPSRRRDPHAGEAPLKLLLEGAPPEPPGTWGPRPCHTIGHTP
jgi:hypothetical protein